MVRPAWASARSLIFEQELAEPAKEFASARLEGVWWRPAGSSEVKLALTNTSDSQLSVTVATRGRGRRNSDSQVITLNPRETRVLSVENHKNTDELDLRGRIGGISISHTGAPGALLSCGFIQDPSKGFSNVIVFSDPQKAKTTHLDGAGLRYGMVSGQRLSQIAVVRNVGSLPSVVSGHIPYTLADGAQGSISLPDIYLAPGEVEKIDLPSVPGEVKVAGLEFNYSTSPGSVIATALSVSRDRNHVFRLPVRDASDQRSSTGHYPWSIDDNSATVVYIKNATDSAKRYTMFVTYEGGYWAGGEKEIPGGQTVAYDLRDLRDNQVANSDGHTIPLTATAGQVHWSVRGQEIRALIGRAEQANTSSGVSATSACGVCCPDSFGLAWLTPGSVSGSIGGVTNFIAYRADGTCYGGSVQYQWAYPGTGYPWGWSCDNTSIATVNGSGQATAVGPGFTYIRNTYYADVYTPNIEDCLVNSVLANAAASCDVALPAVSISEITIDRLELGTGQTATLRATIASGAGASGVMGTVYFYRSRGATGATISPASKAITYGTTQTFEATITRNPEGSAGDIWFKVEADGDTSKVRFVDNPKESPKLVLN